MLVELIGVHKVKRKLADGSVRVHYYAWRGGPKIKAEFGTPAFAAEFHRHKAEAEEKNVYTIETLIELFTGPDGNPNEDWTALAETTRRDHEYAFKLIKGEWPSLPVKVTQAKGMKADIRRWHRSFAANPRKADKLLFSMSKVFSYAIANERCEKNPCTDIPRLYTGSRRNFVWTPDLIAKFRAGARPHLLLPFEIAVGTGQRQGDILSLTWKQFEDSTYLRFDQSKTEVRLKVKAHKALKAMLDELPRDKLRVCLNSRGRPWTTDGFKTSWGKECDRLGIADVTFHDLRGTFITDRIREGSSIEDVALITGHSTSEIKSVLEKHYLAYDQPASDAVILRMENGLQKL